MKSFTSVSVKFTSKRRRNKKYKKLESEPKYDEMEWALHFNVYIYILVFMRNTKLPLLNLFDLVACYFSLRIKSELEGNQMKRKLIPKKKNTKKYNRRNQK